MILTMSQRNFMLKSIYFSSFWMVYTTKPSYYVSLQICQQSARLLDAG